jgi:alanyl-tRNA synthetase
MWAARPNGDKMHSRDVRQAFLDFFGQRDHTVVRSAPLIPRNDPTLFFVNAGMVPFKDVFTGAEVRDYSRATSVQKCLRVSGKHNDLDNVGRTPRHHTFFEMLGNFSFGDYFKEDAIRMAWELLANVYKVDVNRLWVTVYEDDDEAYDLWRSIADFPVARLQRLGAKDNFWSMGATGPCGPCSEIHYDMGPSMGNDERGPAGESDRYVEIWNNVFMQFEQHADGTRTPLPNPSIDTGMGLERITSVLQGVTSNYDTDLFAPILARAAGALGATYGDNADVDTALRVIADHSRAAAFLIADGELPSNVGRGYVLRRIMRRAIRFGVKVGMEAPFLHDTVDQVVHEFAEAYPELTERRAAIDDTVRAEETRFRRVVHHGMQLLDKEMEKVGTEGTIAGDVAFTLSDTFGFPLDLTEQIAQEQGIRVDSEGFDTALEAARERSRAAGGGVGEEAVSALWHALHNENGDTRFTGYDRDADVATVVALARRTDDAMLAVDSLAPGEVGVVLLDRTPFYAESGGQMGDSGTIGAFVVADTKKAAGLFLHHGTAQARVSVGEGVQAEVDGGRRDHTRRNHTATHLLHAALRNHLGDHVTQKGSLVGPNRLRFDFSHNQPLTADEINAIETVVNDRIMENTSVTTDLKSLDDAVADGAMALFGEKYAEDVRVVSIEGYSVELCGGSHVRATGDIGLFKITSETGVAAGVRRLEAQTGTGALQVVQADAVRLDAAARALRTSSDLVVEAISRAIDDRKRLEKELAEMKREVAKAAAGSLMDSARDIGGVKVLAAEFDGDLKEQADRLRDQLGTGVVVLTARRGPKVQLLVAATKDIAGSRIHAGNLIKELAVLVDGRGGGRPDMAQAGGTNPDGIEALLERSYELVASQLGL